MSSSGDGNKTLIYIVAAFAVLGLGAMCCLFAAGGYILYARGEDESITVVEPTVPEPSVITPQAPTGGPSLPVSLEPPPSLRLRPTPTSDRRIRHIEATVVRSEGAIGVSNGDRCSFDVVVLDRGQAPGHYCRTFAECSGVRLFGEDAPRRNGFFPCELYDLPFGVAGEDLEPSLPGGQGDPMFQIDTRTSTFMAADNAMGRHRTAYRVVARIDSVRPR